MRIGVSALVNRPGKVGGVEFMLYNLLRGMTTASQISGDQILAICSDTAQLGDEVDRVDRIQISQRCSTNRYIQESLWNSRGEHQLDSVLYLGHFKPPFDHVKKSSTMIHDLQYLHFPEYFSYQKRALLRFTHEMSLRLSTRIVVISDFVRDDLLEKYGNRWESKVEVIYNPISWPTTPPVQSSLLDSPPTILCVTAQSPHKNLVTLIRAFAHVHSSRPDVRLILVGQRPSVTTKRGQPQSVDSLIEELRLRDMVTITGHVTEEELEEWYKGATVFAFPSLFEGFGMPPVEALGRGLPVVTTNLASLPEVTCGLAQYVDDPLDTHELAERLLQVLESPHRFAPNIQQISMIRERYAVPKIGTEYVQLMKSL